MGDRPKDECGIFGIFAPGEDVARLTFFALFALQHRGEESAGIATSNGHYINVKTGMGLVRQVFDEDSLARLVGHSAIGHNRYSTTGSSRLENAQPLVVRSETGELALGHNGNIVNSENLRNDLQERGYTFSTSTDSEVIAHLIASAPGKSLPDKVAHAMHRLQGAYSLVLLTKDQLVGVRDPLGIRPLSLGRLDGGWVLASETCALDHTGAKVVRRLEPGEILVIDRHGVKSHSVRQDHRSAFCAFEYIYLARPDSVLNERLVYPVRHEMGRRLALEHPVPADLVVPTPDSAFPAAVGYSQESSIPLREGLIKNRYVGRTFIQPDQRIRELGVQLKFNPLPQVLNDKSIVMLDDSIVRGTTTRRTVRLLRQAGAREIHLRICAPPIRYPCFFGVDMATQWELLATQRSIPEIAEYLGADSVGYISTEGLVESIGLHQEELCLACFNGVYPVPVQLEMDKLALERLEALEKSGAPAS